MVTRYVKINGKSYPMKISQEAVLLMAEEEGLQVDQVPALTDVNSWPLRQMMLLLLFSIKVACEHEGKEFDLELKDIRRAIAEDEQFQTDIQKLNQSSQPIPPKVKKKVQAPESSPR
jgi:hypothetical protein